MSKDTSEAQLKDWFGYLASFKTCAEHINTDVIALSPLDFANTKPCTCLAATIDQNQFAISSSSATNIPIQLSDITAAATFVALLGATFGTSNRYLAAYLRFLSPAPFNTMNVGDFQLQKNSVVFPAGAADPLWIKMDSALSNIIDKSCYSPKQRLSLAAIAADKTKIISDLVNQIAKLG